MRRYKGTLTFGILFLIAGVVMLVIAFSNGANSASAKFTEHTYTASEEVTSYNLDLGAGTFVAEFYDGDKAVVEYAENSRYKVTVTEKNGVLSVEAKFKWWVFITFNFSAPKTVVKIPKNTVPDMTLDVNAGKFTLGNGDYGNVKAGLSAGSLNIGAINCQRLTLDISAGSLQVAEARCTDLDIDVSAGGCNVGRATCNSVDVDVSAGSAEIYNLDCPKAVIDVSAGDATLGFCDKEENYSISVDKSAGKCNVNNRTASTGKSISIDLSAGSVTCNFSG